MWQALLAAAVAGSTGIVAKRLFRPCDGGDRGAQSNDGSVIRELEPLNDEKDAIFRFSSSGSKTSSKKKKKKKKEKKEASVDERSGGSESEKRNFGARRYGVSLKRRKVCRNVAGKRAESWSSSQDTSLFSWGIGVGMMCVMSAGNAELGKLNSAMTETAKAVEDLKTELRKRKPSRDLPLPVSSGFKDSEFNMDEMSCNTSIVLTEEPGPGTLEMDRLEAELEFELQKLPWCPMEDSKDLAENELSVQGVPEQMRRDSDTDRLCGSGILPEELDQKLCHLVIERQESQIEELESELSSAQRKLNEKEAELRALKDCVKRLTEISLSTFSDDETEPGMEQEKDQ